MDSSSGPNWLAATFSWEKALCLSLLVGNFQVFTYLLPQYMQEMCSSNATFGGRLGKCFFTWCLEQMGKLRWKRHHQYPTQSYVTMSMPKRNLDLQTKFEYKKAIKCPKKIHLDTARQEAAGFCAQKLPLSKNPKIVVQLWLQYRHKNRQKLSGAQKNIKRVELRWESEREREYKSRAWPIPPLSSFFAVSPLGPSLSLSSLLVGHGRKEEEKLHLILLVLRVCVCVHVRRKRGRLLLHCLSIV